MSLTTAGAMFALALLLSLWLVRPLLGRAHTARIARREANVVAYKRRLDEIATEAEAGLLDAADAASLKAEADARVLADAAAMDAPVTAVATRRIALAAVLSLLFVGIAALGYWRAGSWQTAAQIAAVGPSDDGGAVQPPEVRAMVAKLEARMKEKPEDPEGWALLGRSYSVMERFADAARAYAEANQRSEASHADWLTDEGEALALSRDRDLLGRPQQLFEQALKLAPADGKTLWYSGLASVQAGDLKTARARFTLLAQQELPEGVREALQQRLTELDTLEGKTSAAMPAPAPASVVAASSSPVKLAVQLSIKPDLMKQVPADAVLFVFAKAASGPPMPLAVQRLPGATLPLTVTLDDSMGMMPSLKLSQFDQWVITARYSASGSVQSAPGDVQGSVTVSKAQAVAPIKLELTEKVGG